LAFHRNALQTDPLNSLRIGCVRYLNARPLIRAWPGDVEFDHPSVLCRRLARGELDVALVSSFEFLRNPIYRMVDHVSISSDGPVYSVVVAHRRDIFDIEEIELDPASQTAVNLLRCLLAEFGLEPRLVQRNTGILPAGTAGVSPAVAESDSARRAQLLIGDQAIGFRQSHTGEFQFWDLGEQWQKLVDLPFVYALWLIRPEVRDPKQVADRLRALRDANLAKLDDLIAEVVAGVADPGHRKLDQQFLLRYYREHLRFTFEENEKEGLQSFAKRCAQCDLFPKRDLELDLV
jgi:chorismate dehydratase